MSKVVMTDEEIVSSLKHSQLPTIIVEGPDDTMIYRWMLEEVEKGQACLLPCGGRAALLKVFDRRKEFSHIPVLFIADKDTYVYTGVPPVYSDIVFTSGYSIENDLYRGREIEQLLHGDERELFQKALYNFIRYYGCMYERFVAGNYSDYSFRVHPSQVLTASYDLNGGGVPNGFVEPSQGTVQYLTDEYDNLLRGHSLFQLLLLFLSPQKKRSVKYNTNQLYDICYRQHNSSAIKKMHSVIKTFCDANYVV